MWGRGEFGRLGTGDSAPAAEPVAIDFLEGMDIVKVAAGRGFNMVLTGDGEIYSWGRNHRGQLGHGQGFNMDVYAMESIPTEIEGLEHETIVDISCGALHSIALTEDGHVYQWGMGQWHTPQPVRGNDRSFLEKRIVQIAGGKNYTIAIDCKCTVL